MKMSQIFSFFLLYINISKYQNNQISNIKSKYQNKNAA
jgi:hypothetical protein